MNLSCYIIDDEPHAIDLLAAHIRRTPGISLRGSSTAPLSALQEVGSGTPPDLIFLDVDMPDLNGLALASLLPRGTTIVFCTAFREHAFEAFELQAADYLLKPVTYERFLKCLQKIRSAQPQHVPGTLFVKTGTRGELQGISPAEIRYIAAALNYVEIFFSKERLVCYLTLAELTQALPGSDFAQVHRSFIVNLGFVRKVTYSAVEMTDGRILPIGRIFRQAFRAQMKERSLLSHRDAPA